MIVNPGVDVCIKMRNHRKTPWRTRKAISYWKPK